MVELLCIRARIRVLVCYQSTAANIEGLIESLDEVIKHNKPMEKPNTELLIIVGDDSPKGLPKWNLYFKTVFQVYKWQTTGLKKIQV